MQIRTSVTWWQRLLFGLAALIFSLLVMIAFVTTRDFRQEPNLHWFNGGEIQIVAYILIFGGFVMLGTYLCFVVPLVLFWPVQSQQKHWYAMLGVALLWMPLLQGILLHRPLVFFQETRQQLIFYEWIELPALCSCGCYLLLLRWQHNRQSKRHGRAVDRQQ